jgi:hypothetical protein
MESPSAPGQDERRIDVIAHPDFPFIRPQIGIADWADEDRPLTGAFVNSTLCSEDRVHPLPVFSDDTMIVEVLSRAKRQLAPDVANDATEIRRIEVASYWANHDEKAPHLFSLLEDRGPSREISYAVVGGFTYVAETQKYLNDWIVRAGLPKARKAFHHTVLLDLADIPKYWPSTNKELMGVVMQDGAPGNVQLLASVSMTTEPPVPIILRTPTPEGHVFLAAWCDDPKQSVGTKRTVNTRWRGFPVGRGPQAEIAKRFFLAGETTRGRVYRADPAWLFSRGGNSFAPALLECRIAIIGAGSLGSAIARRLVKAGVGKMIVIDPDILTFDNIARHELGASHVGRSKALELALTLRRDFPHAEVVGYHDRWEDVWRDDSNVIKGSDLIISTVADAGSELHLNHIARTGDLPRIIFGWVEDRAAAAQALLVGGIGGCLGCGLRPTGEFVEQVVQHAEPTLRRVPGCDAFFQPYSALEAESAVIMIVEAALNAIISGSSRSRLLTWIASSKMMAETGASVRQAWKDSFGDSGDGRIRVEREWKRAAECPLCSGDV